MNRRCLRYVTWLLLVLFSSPCFGQVIKVRLVNIKNGHPIQKQKITVSLLYEKSQKAPAKYDARVYLETDANGQTQFDLPEPPPAHLDVRVTLSSGHWHCGCMALTDTQDVIQKGVTVVRPDPGSKAPLIAKAGEILFTARPYTFIERLLYPIEKE